MAMYQGNWTCSKCGGDIKELPFEPRSNSGLTCRDCYFNSKQGDAQGSSSGGGGSAKPASEVDSGSSAELDDRDIPDFDPDEMGTADEPAPEPPEMADAPVAEKKMFEGDWKCSVCGTDIKSLPFKPYNTEGLKCLDCFKKS